MKEAAMNTGSENRWVLVVDDNDCVRELVSSIVALQGYRVVQASDGAEALDLFSQRGFDLILTDLQMPRMDGLSLASKIKDDSPSTPIVLITGSMRDWVEKLVQERPVDRVLYKPFRVEEILETIMAFMGVRDPVVESGP
jgi:CheY-like chemotaxis protein